MVMKNNLASILTVGILATALFFVTTVSSAEATQDYRHRNIGGAIASIQTPEHDDVVSKYILQGDWKLKNKRDQTSFYAEFTMVNVDGTNHHTMWFKQFKQTVDPVVNGNTIVYEGTIDIWAFHKEMMPAPAIITNGDDVPVKISILNNNVIDVSIDYNVNDHFGQTPVYGTVIN